MDNLRKTKDSPMTDALFVSKLEKIASIDELKELCRESGMDFDKENAKTGEEFIGADGEIDDKALENVCGGTACNIPAIMIMNKLFRTAK